MNEETRTPPSAATIAGRFQAFALIGSKCSHAQAACIQQLHDTRAYEDFGLTWEEFCAEHLGCSRSHADHLIRQLEEFGKGYFELSRIIDISDRAYREIAPAVEADAITLYGEKIALVPENVGKIRAGVKALRAALNHEEMKLWVERHRIDIFQGKLKDVIDRYTEYADFPEGPQKLTLRDREQFVIVLNETIKRLQVLRRKFQKIPV